MAKQVRKVTLVAALCGTIGVTVGVAHYLRLVPNNYDAKVVFTDMDGASSETHPFNLAATEEDNVRRRLLAIYHDPKTVHFKRAQVVNLDDSSTTSNSVQRKTQTKKPVAVLHIGPPKTGTTALQAAIREGEESEGSFTKDGFVMPWKIKSRIVNEVAFATCFKSHMWTNWDKSRLCPENDLALLKKLGEEGKNIFLSSEFFSFISDLDELQKILEPWDVTIVYFHRWYYEWLFSQYNQAAKGRLDRKLSKFDQFVAGRGSGDLYLHSFETYFDMIYQRTSSDPKESYQSFYRYKDHFDDVVTLDYHDKENGVVENLFCNGTKHAEHTCQHFLRKKDEVSRTNLAQSLTYKNIAYGAHQLALTSMCSREEFDDVANKIQDHQENTLGRSSYDFPSKCLDKAVLEKLLELSIGHRREILAASPLTKAEEDQIRDEYWDKVKTKSCDADIAAILKMPEWVEFFNALETDTSCHSSKNASPSLRASR
eukprot:CAMPEP_0183754082 /NCGR_PEP_ID=MMETSP0739-20130205/3345_1 /TAXON_ID=385413 /ORGANISM="Thalassiosira miniscula, Strain CCMP1093" /LENGTH=483 /DNA_ID=CAMNT_0025990685 /DNA_START=130 /DNA_END=1581 /DNA_ORIENTATION=-